MQIRILISLRDLPIGSLELETQSRSSRFCFHDAAERRRLGQRRDATVARLHRRTSPCSCSSAAMGSSIYGSSALDFPAGSLALFPSARMRGSMRRPCSSSSAKRPAWATRRNGTDWMASGSSCGSACHRRSTISMRRRWTVATFR